MKQLVLTLALCCGLFVNQAWADATPEDAQTLVKETTDAMLSALTAEKDTIKSNPARVYALVDKIVLPHFDFERMSRFVLGQNWAQATPAQQGKFVQEFRRLLVRTYATALAETAGQAVDINYLPVREEAGAERVTLQTQVKAAGKQPISLDYSMYLLDGAWKVYNISAGGVSLVTTYRTEFNNDISNGGMDKLIAKIAARNKQK
ncbi:MAG: ABC transporter substrate-binding protein [Thiotrichaceae bacterium]|nr:ABC transporter substrate-binding protein [Thiotrichaceae bacterium]